MCIYRFKFNLKLERTNIKDFPYESNFPSAFEKTELINEISYLYYTRVLIEASANNRKKRVGWRGETLLEGTGSSKWQFPY